MALAQVSMDQFLRLSRRVDEFAQRVNGEVILKVFPVGSLFLTLSEKNPAAYLGGTWERYAKGCCLVGVDADDADFVQAGQRVGAKTVALTEAQNGAHTHAQNAHTHVQNAHCHNQARINFYAVATDNPLVAGYTTSQFPWNDTPTSSTAAVNQSTAAVNQASGGGAPHNNIQPSVPVYIWLRVA